MKAKKKKDTPQTPTKNLVHPWCHLDDRPEIAPFPPDPHRPGSLVFGRCRHPGCTWAGERDDLEHHVVLCARKPIACEECGVDMLAHVMQGSTILVFSVY